jgi:hypothetical protein
MKRILLDQIGNLQKVCCIQYRGVLIKPLQSGYRRTVEGFFVNDHHDTLQSNIWQSYTIVLSDHLWKIWRYQRGNQKPTICQVSYVRKCLRKIHLVIVALYLYVFSLSQMWPLNTGLTVYVTARFLGQVKRYFNKVADLNLFYVLNPPLIVKCNVSLQTMSWN